MGFPSSQYRERKAPCSDTEASIATGHEASTHEDGSGAALFIAEPYDPIIPKKVLGQEPSIRSPASKVRQVSEVGLAGAGL